MVPRNLILGARGHAHRQIAALVNLATERVRGVIPGFKGASLGRADVGLSLAQLAGSDPGPVALAEELRGNALVGGPPVRHRASLVLWNGRGGLWVRARPAVLHREGLVEALRRIGRDEGCTR